MIRNSHRTPVTADACEELAAVGATHFEIDVRLLNGAPYSTHFVPVTGVTPWLEHDGRTFRLRPRAVSAEPLEAVMARVPRQCRTVLDLKDDRAARAELLVDRLVREGLDPSRVVVSSKNPQSLATFRRLGYATWLSIANRAGVRRVLRGQLQVPGGAVAVRHGYLGQAVIDALHGRDVRVIAWTVNDPARARTLVGCGVDGITSDDPEVLRQTARAGDA